MAALLRPVVALVVALGVAILTADPLCKAAAVRRRALPDSVCTVYLCKYGYYSQLGCFCPFVTISMDHVTTTRALSSRCNATHTAQALVKFQRTFKLQITAACDAATLEAMRNPRSGGVADDSLLKGTDSSSPSIATLHLSVSRTSFAANASGRPTEMDRRIRMTKRREAQAAATTPATRDALSASGGGGGDDDVPQEAPSRLRFALGRFAANRQPRSKSQRRSSEEAEEAPKKLTPAAAAPPQEAFFETGEDRMLRYWDEINRHYKGGGGSSAHGNASAVDAAAAAASERHKRSVVINSSPFTFTKTSLKWRIISYTGALAQADQNAAMDAAFRQWGAITPLCFSNDQVSDISAIDVVLGFYAGSHPGDTRAFDGTGGELAHTYPGQFTHFDSTESWYTGTTVQTGVALSAIALHEFGHVVGLSHSAVSTAVMYSLYSSPSPTTLLTDDDRSAALAKYGPCGGSFDSAVDVMFSVVTYDDLGNPVTTRYFSSYFFRNAYNWLYVNSLGRPADYEPQLVGSYWPGLPNNVDASFQYSLGGVDQLFFLKGSTVYLYSYASAPVGVTASYAISTFFPAGAIGEPIPNNVDSAYFDPRDGNVYFFKGSLVYIYLYVPAGTHSCCVAKRNISDAFPTSPGQPATVSGVTYQQNVDAVYQSVTNNSVYFFVGSQVWKNVYFNSSSSNATANSIVYLGAWNTFWNYICDVVC